MAGIGHNSHWESKGYRGRLTAWRKARADLLPKTLPLEVVRRRVLRAAELGLDYKAYASIRAATGRDILALLFSTNALRMLKEARLPTDRAAKLDTLKAFRLALTQGRLQPEGVARLPQIDAAYPAPHFAQSWHVMSVHLRQALHETGQKGAATVIIGETSFEADWCMAARAAGYIPAARYFGAA